MGVEIRQGTTGDHSPLLHLGDWRSIFGEPHLLFRETSRCLLAGDAGWCLFLELQCLCVRARGVNGGFVEP